MEENSRLKLLVVMPDDARTEHSLRAWLATAALMEMADVGLLVGGQGEIGKPDAALLFNGPDDIRTMGQLRARGIPIVYSLGPGPVIHGQFADTNAYVPAYRTDRRLKMQLSTLVHADTLEQTRAAEQHFGTKPSWLVIPPAPEIGYEPRERRLPRFLLAIGELRWNPLDWCADHDLQLLRYEDEYQVLNEAMKRDNALVLWGRASFYGDRLLGVAATGTPMAALRCGLVPEGDQAEWFDESPAEALSRALAWDEGRGMAQVKAATGHSWRQWAQTLLEAIRCARPS